MDLRKTIGRNLKTIRRTRKLSQAEIAATLNVTQAAISEYEAAKSTPSIDILYQYAKTFGVSLDFIFGLTSNQTGGILNPEFVQSLSIGTQTIYGNPDAPGTITVEDLRKIVQEELAKKLGEGDEGK